MRSGCMRSVCFACVDACGVDACGVFASLVWMHAEHRGGTRYFGEILARFRSIIRSDRAFCTDMPRVMTIAMPRVLTSLAQELVKIS